MKHLKKMYCQTFTVLEITTIEGIIDRSIAGLEQDQVLRRIQHPEVAQQIDDFIQKLKDLKGQPFTLVSFKCIKQNRNYKFNFYCRS